MMYQSKMVLAIKSQGKILREFGDEVKLPFGSEFSVLIKNLNTVRAMVNVYIDGTNVVPGGLVVNANSEIDLERYLNNGNMNAGNKFMFIERTSKVEQGRGIEAEDGLVRIEYKYEIFPTYTPPLTTYRPLGSPTPYNPNDKWYGAGTWCCDSNTLTNSTIGAVNATYTATSGHTGKSLLRGTAASSANSVEPQGFVNNVGITVPGRVSDQKFQYVGWFPTEATAHTMILRLVGFTGQEKVQRPITVKSKAKCITCKHLNKANAKFCSECGTSLVLV